MGCCDTIGNFGTLLALVATAGGIVAQSFAAYECEFLKYTTDTGSEGSFGLFRWNLADNVTTADICDSYQIIETNDQFLSAARAMITLALILAMGAFVLVLFEFVCCKICCAGIIEGLCLTTAKICTGVTYVAYGSQFCVTNGFSCQFGAGATYNIVAFGLYLIAGVLLCCTPKPDPLFKQCRK